MSKLVKLIPTALLACSMGAQAAITITIQEVGDAVVVSGTGTIATEWLSEASSTQIFSTDILNPSNYTIQAGNPTTSMNLYDLQAIPEDPLNNVPRFGNGPAVSQATNNTGDAFGVSFPNANIIQLAIPANYVANDEISFRFTFAESSLQSLGIELGSSTWNWTGQPELGEHVTLNVIPREDVPPAPSAPTPVPALGIVALTGLAGVIGAAGCAMNRRRKQS